MAAQNQFLAFGIGSGANVLTPAQYAALAALGPGFATGILQSNQLNSVLRQASFVSAMIGQFIADQSGNSALDDGNLAELEGNFELALRSYVSLYPAYEVDTGVANAYVVAMPVPVTAYTNGMQVKFRVAHANTGASTLNAGGGAVALLSNTGVALAAGDLPLGALVNATYDSALGKFLIHGLVYSQFGALALLNYGNGVQNDGSGNLTLKLADGSMRLTGAGLQGNEPITTLSGTVNVAAANHFANFVGTGTLNLPQTTSLWNGFCFSVVANGGSVTLNPNAADGFGGTGAGSPYTLNNGQTALFICDGNGNWWIFYLTTPASVAGNSYNYAYQAGFIL
ncbi:hypothetical protein QF001_000945 [Paraburkholderia youngii]|uniref:hypothetical protein n=1 Tax=Paraburkholderia youngii TaxID=2782701 RepID=UPI003D247D38